ncbi:DNA repair protein RecO [Melioribacter sp. OK-6-Me]|uniref:DNA repair protein RecO n=1 Tax=unclassified Melioribacter TaxID=2627329 RepID=UPI003EDAD21A
MSEIIKTDAVVLNKLNYGDTSKIAHLFTRDYGKMSAIVKGARSPKSKIGMIVDTLNIIQVIIYKKETREIQLISNADLLKHFSIIKEDIERMKYATAVVELLLQLTIELDPHPRLFDGTVRILELINNPDKNPKYYFTKYLLFFIKEIGYQFPTTHCSVCGKELKTNMLVNYNYDSGIMCEECSKDRMSHFRFTKELFNLLQCLSTKNFNIEYSDNDLSTLIMLLEKFLKYHIDEFKGLRSLKVL